MSNNIKLIHMKTLSELLKYPDDTLTPQMWCLKQSIINKETKIASTIPETELSQWVVDEMSYGYRLLEPPESEPN